MNHAVKMLQASKLPKECQIDLYQMYMEEAEEKSEESAIEWLSEIIEEEKEEQ